MRRHFRLILVLSVLSIARLSAQSSLAPAHDSTRIALTVSGGVSLGNYQAGATYAFIHALRYRDRMLVRMSKAPWDVPGVSLESIPRFRLDVLTGASAGNGNALIAAFDYCAEQGVKNPEKSLYWKLWVDLGYSSLMRRRTNARETGVFSRESLGRIAEDLQRQTETANGRAKCSTTVGITATKLRPMSDSIV